MRKRLIAVSADIRGSGFVHKNAHFRIIAFALMITGCVAMLFPSRVFSQTLSGRDLLIPSAKTDALGGIHGAAADGLTTLFSNPAGFASVPASLNIAELNVGLMGPVFTIAGLLLGGTTNILTSPALASLVSSLYTGVDLGGPLAFGYVGNGLGFGIFNDTRLLLSTSGIDSIDLEASERTIVAGGYAFRIPIAPLDGALDIGVLLKGFVIGNVTVSGTLISINSVISSLNIDTLLNNPFDITSGIGVDTGLRLSMWNDMLALGITATNLYTPAIVNHYASVKSFLNGDGTTSAADNVVAPINISSGIEFTPPLGRLGQYIDALNLYLDYRNIFDFLLYPATAENIVLKFSAGLQVRLLEILSLRAGFARGLPAFGIGLDLTAFTVNVAVFGDELSTEPGLRSVYNLVVGFVVKM